MNRPSSSHHRRYLVVVATYNERENLPQLLPAIWAVHPEFDILVIDDNSPDGTGKWVETQLSSEPRLKYLPRPAKLGLGTAAVAAMKVAIEHDYDYLINMDADFSHDPAYLSDLIAAIDSPDSAPADVVIGSRYVPGGGTAGWPWYRRLMSRMVNTYARLWLRLPLKDCSGGYRCFRVATLSRIEFDQVRAHGYVFHEEILWHLRRVGARLREVPIVFVDRRFGESKIRAIDAAVAVWRIFLLGCIEHFGRPPRHS